MSCSRLPRAAIACSLVLWCACATSRSFTAADDAAVRGVLVAQQAAWNRGDLEGYMAGYLNAAELVFTSASKIRRGWQETHDTYKTKYGSGPKASSTMGKLAFEILGVQALGADGAIVLGRWKL